MTGWGVMGIVRSPAGMETNIMLIQYSCLNLKEIWKKMHFCCIYTALALPPVLKKNLPATSFESRSHDNVIRNYRRYIFINDVNSTVMAGVIFCEDSGLVGMVVMMSCTRAAVY